MLLLLPLPLLLYLLLPLQLLLPLLCNYSFKQKTHRNNKIPVGKKIFFIYYIFSSSIILFAFLIALSFSIFFSTDGFEKNCLFLNSFNIPAFSYFFLNLFRALSRDSLSCTITFIKENYPFLGL